MDYTMKHHEASGKSSPESIQANVSMPITSYYKHHSDIRKSFYFIFKKRIFINFISYTRKEKPMKSKSVCILFVILLAAIIASSGLASDEAKIVVMNPRGIQPEIRKIPMAARPETLDGKMVYIVDTKYPNTKPFVEALHAALKSKYPKTTWVLRDKFAGYMDDDPKLWNEIKEKGAGAIVLLGH